MATKKNKTAKTTKKSNPVRLLKTSLVAVAAGVSSPAKLSVVFRSGIGQITASLFRKGVMINMQSISRTGDINFSDVKRGDAIAVNGVCTGTADITINVTTNPTTPEHFTAGIIMGGYSIS